MERFVCIHGHFYQPQRENPWLEAIEVQDSAYPYHDWNARVTAECYAPNARARRLGPDGKIAAIVNNYAQISFNFGATLLAWMAENAPETYAAILEADRQSRERFAGHGNALAQVHSHVILPLANERDKRTQVVWGIRDFEQRFGRPPEGMWLAETAVDLATLELVAAQGLRFTILSPHQASSVRRIAGGKWRSVEGGRIDPTMPYSIKLPSGRTFVLYFYDGPISQAVAFERLLADGRRFAERLASGFDDARGRTELVHIATDGETYGHHHRYGEMALAYALHHVEAHGNARLTNYGEHLDRFEPTHRVQIFERTSWSCAHGVERWWRDCGCNSGAKPGWNQAWRTPLRNALDWLRDALAPEYERLGREILRDPWAARDDYIDVLLDRSRQDAFLDRHAARPLSQPDRVRALQLLEMQRNALLMYTSCGWFFDDLGGIETVQVIQYAARAIQLARAAGAPDLEPGFRERLAEARGNMLDQGTGSDAYARVTAARLDLRAIGAHYAMRSLFEPSEDVARVACYTAEKGEVARWEAGRQTLVSGSVRITSDVTRESELYSFAVLHLGDHNVQAGVRELGDGTSQRTFVEQAGALFERGEQAEVMRVFDRAYEGSIHTLRSLYRDEQRRILERILSVNLAEAEATLRQVHDNGAGLLRYLASLGSPAPEALRAAARFALESELRRALAEGNVDVERVRALFEAARVEAVELDAKGLGLALEQALVRTMLALAAAPADLARLRDAAALVELQRGLAFPVELWQAQNLAWKILREEWPALGAREGDDARAWSETFRGLADVLSLRVD